MAPPTCATAAEAISSTGGSPAPPLPSGVTAGQVAVEKSAVAWHATQLPTGTPVSVPSLTKTSRPRRSCAVSSAFAAADAGPPAWRHWSYRVWSDTSVAWYICSAMPKRSGKFASTCGVPSGVGMVVRQSSRNACAMSWRYVDTRPMPSGAARLPSTESLGATRWPASARRSSSLAARFGKVLPEHDISTPLVTGPTACEASEAFCSMTCTGSTAFVPNVLRHTRAPGSSGPSPLTPLNQALARPSQKLRTLNTALMIDGGLRAVTCRTFAPSAWNTGSGTSSHASEAETRSSCR